MILIPAFAYCALHIIGRFYPATFWGTDQLHYYPSSMLVVFVSACLAALLVATKTSWSINIDSFIIRLFEPLQEKPLWLKVIFPSLFLFAAYTYRAQSHHLGDSSKWFNELATALWQGEGLFSLVASDIPIFEPLDFIIHLQVYRLGHHFFAWIPTDTYAHLSCIAGMFYVASIWKITAFLCSNFTDRYTFFFLLLTLGSIQLFFGYGESYTILALSSALYVLFSLRFLKGHSFAFPTLCLLFSSALHIMALSLLPSWLYLLWHKMKRPSGGLFKKPHIYLPATTICGVLLFYLYSGFYPNNLPLVTPREEGQYALFSLPHLLLLGNAILLLSPFGIVWGFIFLLTRTPSKADTSFFGWAALGTGLLIVFHDAYLGGRDWDLMSYPSLHYTLWGISCLQLFPMKQKHNRELRLVVLPIMVIHTVLWIGINSNQERATNRLGFLLESSNQPRHYRAFTLGHFYLNIQKKDIDEGVRWLREAIAFAPPDSIDPTGQYRSRYKEALGLGLVTYGQYQESIDIFQELYPNCESAGRSANELSSHHARIAASFRLGDQEYQKGDIERAEVFCKAALECYRQVLHANRKILSPASYYNHFVPHNDRVYYNLGIVYFETYNLERAVQAFSRAIIINPGYALAHSNLGTTLRSLGRLSESERSYRNAIQIQPDNPVFHHNLAGLKFEQNDAEGAKAIFMKAIKLQSKNIDTYLSLGRLYLESEQLEEAHKILLRTIDENLEGADSSIYAHVGKILQQLGQTDDSMRAFEKAVDEKEQLSK